MYATTSEAVSVMINVTGRKNMNFPITLFQNMSGKKGAMVREIGSRARPEVERLVGHPVFLELVVKVRSKWRRDPHMIERLGM